MNTFPKNLARLMEGQGINATNLAKACGLSKAVVSQYLHGSCKPSQKTLPLLAEALGCEVAELTEEPPRPPIDTSKAMYDVWEAAALMGISKGELTSIIRQGNAHPWGTGHVQKSGKFKPRIFAKPLNDLLGIQ